jgi:hypothetical protein
VPYFFGREAPFAIICDFGFTRILRPLPSYLKKALPFGNAF